MRLTKKRIISFLLSNFIFVIIQACFLSPLTHAMHEDELLPSTLKVRQEEPLPERTEEDSSIISLQRDTPIKEDEDTALFLLLPLDFHMALDSYLDLPSQWSLARVCKGTLDIAALLTFCKLYRSLPTEVRCHMFGDKVSSEEAYTIFRNLSDEAALETLYVQSLLLEIHDKKNYASLRLVLLKNPHFRTEEEAKQKAKEIFCLSDQEQESGSWMKTLILYRLFWQNYKNPPILGWLSEKGIYLAQLLENMREDSPMIDCSESQKNTRSILSAIALTQRKLISDTAAIGSCGLCFVSLAKACGLLSKEGALSEGLDQLALESDSLSNEGVAKEQLRQLLTSQKKPINSTVSYDYEPLIFFLSKGLLEIENRKVICDLAAEENFEGLETVLMNVCLDGMSKFYQSQLVQLYTELLDSESTLFILIWQNNLPFLIGLSEDNQAALYYKAQSAYQKRFGRVHSGQFTVDSPFSFSGVISDRFYDENTETYAEEAERRWGPLVELGDSKIAYELAKAWATSQQINARERALYWFSHYERLAPSLPFGDFSTLGDYLCMRYNLTPPGN
ncbi:MAG: hypothetical protein HYX35_03675 [Proteobacteria bacterium]|nr:hypothetical protein [Pseudomonadota bacterium]